MKKLLLCLLLLLAGIMAMANQVDLKQRANAVAQSDQGDRYVWTVVRNWWKPDELYTATGFLVLSRKEKGQTVKAIVNYTGHRQVSHFCCITAGTQLVLGYTEKLQKVKALESDDVGPWLTILSVDSAAPR